MNGEIIKANGVDAIESAIGEQFDVTQDGVKDAIAIVVKAAEAGEREIYSDFLGVWVDLP